MLYLLNPRVWIAIIAIAALSFTHFSTYRAGKAAVRAQWDKEKVVQLEAARKQEESFRRKEQELLSAKQKVEERYAQLKKRAASSAADARTELDRLRDELAAAPTGSCPASPNAAPIPGADGRAGLERELLGHCATTLVGLASEADRLEARIVGLQSYIRGVCLKQ